MQMKTFIKQVIFTAGFITTIAFATSHATPTKTTFSPEQTKAIQKIVHDYLVNNPQVLVEASQKLQQQMAAKQQQQAIQAIKKNANALFDNASTPFIGNPKGDVIMVEFFDYQCGHCKTMNTLCKNS